MGKFFKLDSSISLNFCHKSILSFLIAEKTLKINDKFELAGAAFISFQVFFSLHTMQTSRTFLLIILIFIKTHVAFCTFFSWKMGLWPLGCTQDGYSCPGWLSWAHIIKIQSSSASLGLVYHYLVWLLSKISAELHFICSIVQ